MLRGVLFDAGNTVVFPDYSIYVSIAASLGSEVTLDDVLRAEALARSAFDDAVAASGGGGVMRFWQTYYEPFYERLGIPGDALPVAIERTRAANDEGLGIWRVPVDGLHETMDELDVRGLIVGIISNSDGRLEQRLGEIGILDRFDFVIDSAVVGVSKPDHRIFEVGLKAGGLAPSEAAYVGDYYAVDVVGARGVGMRPVLFDPYGAYQNVDCRVIRRFADVVGLVDEWSGDPSRGDNP
jgi:putative hydrolase of the HAD superfamily